jgi:hypothetical protein
LASPETVIRAHSPSLARRLLAGGDPATDSHRLSHQAMIYQGLFGSSITGTGGVVTSPALT